MAIKVLPDHHTALKHEYVRTQSDLYNLNRRNQKGKKEGEGQKHSVYTTQAIQNLIFTHGKKFVNFFSEQNRNYK